MGIVSVHSVLALFVGAFLVAQVVPMVTSHAVASQANLQHLQRRVPRVNSYFTGFPRPSMRRTGVNDDNIVAEDLLGLSEPLPMVYASQYYEDEFKHNILTRFAQLQSLDDVLVHLVIASQADDTVSAFVTSQLYILMETLDNHATQGTDATAQAFNDAGIVSEYFELLKEDALQGSDEGDTHFYERACEILHELVAPYLAVQAQGITVRYSEQVARYSGSQLTPDSMFAYSLVQAIADMGLAPTQNDDVLVRDTAQRITVESPQELAQEFVVGLFRSRAMILKKPM